VGTSFWEKFFLRKQVTAKSKEQDNGYFHAEHHQGIMIMRDEYERNIYLSFLLFRVSIPTVVLVYYSLLLSLLREK